jgi:tetratricopeptide (TPR) repeat protein
MAKCSNAVSICMIRSLVAVVMLLAQDVYTPPIFVGVKGEKAGKVRKSKPIPFPDEKFSWLRVRTPSFDIISSAPEAETKKIARDLETLAGALRGTLSRAQNARTAPATVFVFARRRESQPYFNLLIGREGTPVSGVYVRHDGGGTMFIDAARSRFERTAMHELIHDLLRQGDVLPPLWVEEGLAEYFSNAQIRDDAVVAGKASSEHAALIKRAKAIEIEEMFAVKAESSMATAPLFYAQSWAAVDWLMQLDPTRIDAFIRDLAGGVTPENALQTHYGKSVEDLRNAVRAAGRGSKAVRIDTQAHPHDPQAAPIDRATLLYELGRFLSHVAGAEEDTQRHYKEALRIDPRHARTLAAIGEFDKAIAADPSNAEVHLIYAESLMTGALGPAAGVFEPDANDADNFRKARALAEKALALGGEESLARGLIGSSYAVETDVKPAIPHLERAHALAPSRMDFALHLYSFLLRGGERAKADALFASAFERARDKQTVFAARNILLIHETDRANALSRAGKLDEAAEIVRSLAASTQDALARRELEQQAEKLAATAAVNRHIQMYNQAVVASNAGRTKDAIQILDALLKVATDEQVVRDAQRLRGEIRKR